MNDHENGCAEEDAEVDYENDGMEEEDSESGEESEEPPRKRAKKD